ncbi:hypothetical protein, partial [Klebsiella michiganensis]|uniref:hypothetical protein n=1 Tax=Klebsiella michiganensis TaxID=1134687 RepID=UPI00300BB654
GSEVSRLSVAIQLPTGVVSMKEFPFTPLGTGVTSTELTLPVMYTLFVLVSMMNEKTIGFFAL